MAAFVLLGGSGPSSGTTYVAVGVAVILVGVFLDLLLGTVTGPSAIAPSSRFVILLTGLLAGTAIVLGGIYLLRRERAEETDRSPTDAP
jgi:ABC-type transport system involved in multi-copper enzyme maturation permease subunit